MFQGVTLYAVLALFVYWREAARQLDEFRAETAAPSHQLSPGKRSAQETLGSLLIRCEKDVVPLSMNEIVRITGTDGYAEVFTTTKRILSTTSLARFEEILPGDQFIRAHRSHIVRLGAVRNAEPAGNGKLVLNLADGQSITTSRTGAKRLRELAV
jgi:DNA-binding LytR/AlgR family response regulator